MSSLTDLSRYVYGTTRLGDDSIPFADRVVIAEKAMDAGVWFHSSHQYGNALEVLNAAFDSNRSKTPRMIFKIGWSSVDEIRGQIELQLNAVGKTHMDVGQLCAGGDIADHLINGGSTLAGLSQLKEEGLVGNFVLEVFPWTSHIALGALQSGNSIGLIDGYIFYLNPLQRFASNELWNLLMDRGDKIVAMRTVSGGDVMKLKDNTDAPAWLRERAQEVAPLFVESGIGTWSEFAARYSLGFTNVIATVGASSREAGLNEFLAATQDPKPLDSGIVDKILEMQRRWSDDVDMKAEPWTM
ncbi:MAG TPA: hypothetical protein VK171_01330 [Fimbriimonas sp.]|nr:hypothetical protein [Fimbriimonas sp.]